MCHGLWSSVPTIGRLKFQIPASETRAFGGKPQTRGAGAYDLGGLSETGWTVRPRMLTRRRISYRAKYAAGCVSEGGRIGIACQASGWQYPSFHDEVGCPE